MSEKRNRQQAVRCRVSAAETAILQAAAKAREQPVGTFIREAALQAADPHLSGTDRKLTAVFLRNFLVELQRIAQTLRRRKIDHADIQRMVHELQRLQLLILRSNRQESDG